MTTRRQARRRLAAPAILLLALLVSCRTPRPPPHVVTGPAPSCAAAERPFRGEVVLVNERLRYLIVRSTLLPSGPVEAKVFRGTNEVGRVRITGPARPPLVAADLLRGQPQVGDRVQGVGETKRTLESRGGAP